MTADTDGTLQRLTLVVPTYERAKYALRNMRYWSGRGPTIHVLDGSKQPIDLNSLAAFGGNIHYHHRPEPIAKRIERAFQLIDSEYVAMLCDDEFFLPSGLKASIDELDRDREIVACMGSPLGFKASDCGIEGSIAYPKMHGWSSPGLVDIPDLWVKGGCCHAEVPCPVSARVPPADGRAG